MQREKLEMEEIIKLEKEKMKFDKEEKERERQHVKW